jgi:hypothetical protein
VWCSLNLGDRSRTIGVEAESEQSNRLFILLALALVGLICIGLLGLGGVVGYTRFNQAVEEAAVPPTPTPIPPTLTPTSTPSATPTETPRPTPTGTPVVSVGGEETGPPPEGGEAAEPTATGTRLLEGATAIPTVGTAIVTLEPPTPIATATEEATTGEAVTMPGSGGVLPAGNHVLVWTGLGLLVLLIVGVTSRLKKS